MLSRERQNLIVEYLRSCKTAKIDELTGFLRVSVATVRRDLAELERQELIERVYGGAVLARDSSSVRPVFSVRAERCSHEKAAIGKAAAGLINEGETVILGIGTTTSEIAKHVKNVPHLTVLTNSLPVLNELALGTASVYALGGKLRGQELAFSGGIADENLSRFFADKAFIGAGGITFECGITDYTPDSAHLCADIIKHAREVILVADSSKFGKNGFAVACGIDCVNTVVTDAGIPEEYKERFAELGIKLILA